ncbi:MAG: hypothetical protein ABI855_20505, partial [Bacteroidota bacterium]
KINMMELIVAILIALGALTSDRDFNDEYVNTHQTEISKAKTIIDHSQYKVNTSTGGVIVDPGVGV